MGKGKTKSILFGTKFNMKWVEPLNIVYDNVEIKQYFKVAYLYCIIGKSLLGKSIALHVINKINSRLRVLYRHSVH